jgi:VWFA-related protein
MMARSFLLANLVLLTAGAAAAQNPVFQSETRIVQVAVVAKDPHDEPVTDLTVDDLRVFDNSVEQKILSFEKLWDPPRAADGLPIGLPPKRRSVILLDMLQPPNPGKPFQIYGRQDAAEMLKRIPQTLDTVAVFALSDELKMLHDFSPFTFGLRGALEGFGGQPPAMPPANMLLWKLKSLTKLAHMMEDIPGEKNLLWVAPSFPPPNDMQEVVPAIRALIAARVSLYPVCLISQLAGPIAYEKVDGVRELAELTGGRAYYSGDSLADLLVAAMNDSREGYLLSFTPARYRADGSVHDVKLKIERKGIELRYRPSYSAVPAGK